MSGDHDPFLVNTSDACTGMPTREKGRCFESFTEGETIEHERGIRLTHAGSDSWASQTLNHDPAYWRPDAAEERGYDGIPIHPDYVLAATMGPSVEDLSEKGGYFLGRTDVRYPSSPVAPGTDLVVESETVATRESGSRPDYGIVTWETRGRDADTGAVVCAYTRTNLIPRRDPTSTREAGDGTASDEGGDAGGGTDAGDEAASGADESPSPSLPESFVGPDGPYFEDIQVALERVSGRNAAVAFRHERGRTVDDYLLSVLPLRTLNTAKQHHDATTMADSPSGESVVYGDVTRSVALGHARSDTATWRELRYTDERFHDFVVAGDTISAFTRVLDAEPVERADVADGADPDSVGRVTFKHYAVNQRTEPVYSGIRTALIRRHP